MIQLAGTDILVIIAYFLVVFLIAFWAIVKRKGKQNSGEYFLAGRNMGWFVVGASLFASNIGSEHLIGLAGSGFSSGVSVAQYEIWAGLILLLLGWVFVPFYLKSGVATMPEFLEKRYSPATRSYLAVISVIGYVLTKISVTIYAGGIVFSAIGMDFWTGALLLVVATGIYTIAGGLRAVVYTDTLQMFVLVGGAITVTIFGLHQIGGFQALKLQAGSGFFNMWKPASHPNYPWTGILFGAPILGVWYWCTDQFIVQRVLSAKDIANARKGSIFAGFLKMLPLFIFVFPGIIAYVLMQQGQLQISNPNETLPVLIKTLLPAGLRGLVIAGLFAALMSSLSSVFNSCSTLITLDFYKKYRPAASEKTLVWVGQLSTALLVVLGLLWIPFMKFFSNQLYLYLQSVQAYIAPPIAAVFLLGLFFKRLNAIGALSALWTGFFLGAARLIAELFKSSIHPGTPLFFFANVNFLHFAIMLFILCVVVLTLVSLATSPPDKLQIEQLVYHKSSFHIRNLLLSKEWWLSVLLLLLVASIWIYFS